VLKTAIFSRYNVVADTVGVASVALTQLALKAVTLSELTQNKWFKLTQGDHSQYQSKAHM